MPITKFTLENFKSISDRTEVELKPSTVRSSVNNSTPDSSPLKRKLSAL
ncbi:MAG: hypothetical protein GVY36_16080 [Verrucomicrobia bacterium]|jgi:hypothetical protein|nr:hypothetical protein [Verrucomicrobiota bacterium]